jgi:hypothetical protein
MIGRIAYDAARWQVRSYKKSRNQQGGPWTFTAVLFCVLPFTILWMLTSLFQAHWGTFGILVPVNVVLVLLALLPVFSRVSYRNRIAQQDRERYDPASPEAMRELAGELEALGALRGLPEPEPPTATWQSAPEQPEPDPDPDEAERKRRVAALFAVDCPEDQCLAPPPLPCVMGDGIPVAVVDREKILFCHLLRMTAAIQAGTATQDEVLAQFGYSAEGAL